MAMSIFSQCDTSKYFSLSTIDKNRMEELGLNMTVKQLREQARHSVPVSEVPTGSHNPGQFRMTKIYRYLDFKKEGDAE